MWESLNLALNPAEKAAMMRELQREGAAADQRYQGKAK
jgi:hypothetical protein